MQLDAPQHFNNALEFVVSVNRLNNAGFGLKILALIIGSPEYQTIVEEKVLPNLPSKARGEFNAHLDHVDVESPDKTLVGVIAVGLNNIGGSAVDDFLESVNLFATVYGGDIANTNMETPPELDATLVFRVLTFSMNEPPVDIFQRLSEY